MQFLKYFTIIIPILLTACSSNAKNDTANVNKIKEKQEEVSSQNVPPKSSSVSATKEKIVISNCEPDYQSLNYCTQKFQKLLQEESQKPANFDKNKRVIVTKVQMKHNKKGIYEHHLVVLDLDTKKAYPLSQVVTSFSDEKSYLISEQPKIDYDINSNKICFSGTLIGYRDSYDNVDNACYEFNEKDQSFIPINMPFTERKIASEVTPVTTKPAIKNSNLPFTQKNIDTQDIAHTQISDFPQNSNEIIQNQIQKFIGGSSDAGYYQLPNLGSVQVFVGYGLFEDEDKEHITKDNPNGAFADQVNYLITINGDKLNHIQLGNKFTIDKDYQNITSNDGSVKSTYSIAPTGLITKK